MYRSLSTAFLSLHLCAPVKKQNETVLSIYSDKLAHILVVINCLSFVAPMCTREDMLAHNLGAPYNDDVMSVNA